MTNGESDFESLGFTNAHQADTIPVQCVGLLQVTQCTFSHRCEYRIRFELGYDERAPGGAVTVALCGHWDHEGPCRWPHFSAISPDPSGHHRLVVEFNAPEDELEMVRAKIDAAVSHGQLTGPDGVVSNWAIHL